MKTKNVKVPWRDGLHMLPAGIIVTVARRFRSRIRLKVGSRIADATSVISLVILCATLNTSLEVEADGEDEQDAIEAVASCFDAGGLNAAASSRAVE